MLLDRIEEYVKQVSLTSCSARIDPAMFENCKKYTISNKIS